MDLAALIYHRQAFLDGQWWLPLTAQLVHFNAAHALANGAGALLLVSLFRAHLGWRRQGAVLLGGALGVVAVVVLDAACDYYAGASGVLHGWAAGGALLWWRESLVKPKADCWQRRMALGLLLGVFLKILWQSANDQNVFAWGFPVYQPAHLAGALGGLVAAVWLARSARHPASPGCHQRHERQPDQG